MNNVAKNHVRNEIPSPMLLVLRKFNKFVTRRHSNVLLSRSIKDADHIAEGMLLPAKHVCVKTVVKS